MGDHDEIAMGSRWNRGVEVQWRLPAMRGKHLQHLLAEMQAEQPATFDEKAHLVFGVGVL